MAYYEHLLTNIGYLPAEHIETPLERLARLNKHRNLDVRSLFLRAQNKVLTVILTFSSPKRCSAMRKRRSLEIR